MRAGLPDSPLTTSRPIIRPETHSCSELLLGEIARKRCFWRACSSRIRLRQDLRFATNIRFGVLSEPAGERQPLPSCSA